MALYAELEKMNNTNLKLEKKIKTKVKPKRNTNNKFNQKGNSKNPPKHNNKDKYAWKKVSPKQGKKERKLCLTKLTTGVSGIRHG